MAPDLGPERAEVDPRQIVRAQALPRAGRDMGRDVADRSEPLGRPILLEDVEADAVHGHGVAVEEDAVSKINFLFCGGSSRLKFHIGFPFCHRR